MQLDYVYANKKFTISKFIIVSLLVIIAVLALVSAWFVNRDNSDSLDQISAWQAQHVAGDSILYYHKAATSFYALLLVFGIGSLACAISILGSRTKAYVVIAVPLGLVIFIVTLVLVVLGVQDTGAQVFHGLAQA